MMIACAISLRELTWHTSGPDRLCSFPCSSADECIQGKVFMTPMPAPRDHGLNDAHFDLFLKHFRVALEEVGVKPENAEKIMKRLESKRGTVLNQRLLFRIGTKNA